MEDNFYINPDKITEYIPLKECIDSMLYIINARNSNLGIFNKKDSSFTISRFKFSLNYLYEEDHWDTGEPNGTVKPLKALDLINFLEMNDEEKLKFLNKRAVQLKDEIKLLFSKEEHML